MKYRKEIDGLRALAVLPVILFHAGYEMFNGGYIGVDIFFVISGYLITTIIIEDISAKKFSVIDFYERRARRILPALFSMILFCIPFAWLLMLPTQMESFSKSLISATLFFSNILFWKEGGYFGAPVEQKPLIHTWSLSIEEQFYLFFPFLLIIFWKNKNDTFFWIIFIILIISFSLSEWGWRNRPNANFYLTPTRIWELLIGSLTALLIFKKEIKSSNFLSIIGFFIITLSIFIYDKSTPFPSVFTLVPIIGVVLIIIFGKEGTLISQILGNKFLVKIGLISYSLYLFHQPLFAFLKISILNNEETIFKIIVIIFSFLLAYSNWKFIEQPFRNKDKIKRKTFFNLSLFIALFFITVGFLGKNTKGFKDYRFSLSDREFLNVLHEKNYAYVLKKFEDLKNKEWDNNQNTQNIILVGDSYAKDIANSIFETDLSKSFSVITHEIPPRCGNLFIGFLIKEEFILNKLISQCKKYDLYRNDKIIEKFKNADQIWFASSWSQWEEKYINLSVENLSSITSAKILIFGRKDFPIFKPQKYIGMTRNERSNYIEKIDNDAFNLNNKMKLNLDSKNFIDIQKLMCGEIPPKCKVFDNSGKLKTWDGAHLTKEGAIWLGNELNYFFNSKK